MDRARKDFGLWNIGEGDKIMLNPSKIIGGGGGGGGRGLG